MLDRWLLPLLPSLSLFLSFCIHYILILLTERLRVFSELPRQLNITSLASSSFFFSPSLLSPSSVVSPHAFLFLLLPPPRGRGKKSSVLAYSRVRTDDLTVNSRTLYLLSYASRRASHPKLWTAGFCSRGRNIALLILIAFQSSRPLVERG